MKVSELIKGRQLFTIRPGDTLALAAQMMAWGGIRHLPVTRDGQLLGVLSERDVLRHRADLGSTSDVVETAMTAPARVAAPDDDVAELETRLLDAKIGCFPVVESGRLVGIVTTTDLLAARVRREADGPEAPRPARELMVRGPARVREIDPLLDAIARMVDRGVRHLPVVDAADHVLGMLSDRGVRTVVGDPLAALRSRTIRRRLGHVLVRDAMNGAAPVVGEETPLHHVVGLFLRERLGAIAVVDVQQRLAGLISYLDLLRVLGPPP